MLDLGDHPSRPVPGRGLILKVPVSPQRGVARPAPRPGQQILDCPLAALTPAWPSTSGAWTPTPPSWPSG
jgi:hypothetical protein